MAQRRTLLIAAAGGAVIGAAGTLGLPALAAAWPSRPLRIIVPFPPGGSSDLIARLISKPLGDALNTTVVVENKTGANGSIGAAATAQADDEHTLLLSDMSSLAINPLVTKDMPYKPEQLKGATLLAYSPHLLVAHPSVAASNISELVALSKQRALNVASSGTGSANHLGVVDIALATGLKWVHVPFRGGSQALGDTAAGNTQLCLNGMLATMPLVTAGRLKLIGVSKATRMALLAQSPTIAEQGVKGFESGTWQGLLMAATTPPAVRNRLNAELVNIIRSPEIRAKLVGQGAEVVTMNPTEFERFFNAERARWAAVVSAAGIKLDA